MVTGIHSSYEAAGLKSVEAGAKTRASVLKRTLPSHDGALHITTGPKMLPERRSPDQGACGFRELFGETCDILTTH
jgi:hypothetical protein